MAETNPTIAVFAQLQHDIRPDEAAVERAGEAVLGELVAALTELRGMTREGQQVLSVSRENEPSGQPKKFIYVAAGSSQRAVVVVYDKTGVFWQPAAPAGDWVQIPLKFDPLKGAYVDPAPLPGEQPKSASVIVAEAVAAALRERLRLVAK